MKREWNKASLLELTILNTNNQPTYELKADDVIIGVGLKQGEQDCEKPVDYPIPYWPMS